MTAIALSLAAALCWGVADFGGGLNSRRVPVPVVLLWIETTGTALVLAVIVATGEGLPDARTFLLGMVAGLMGIGGLACFYRALAIGTMSIVAPVSATGVVFPVVVGLATGDRLGTVVAIGLAVTFVGVLLASREEAIEGASARGGRLALVLALLSAVGFGGWFVFSDPASDGSVLWMLLAGRIATLPLIYLVVRRVGASPVPPRPVGAVLVACGTFDLLATALYGVANTKGALAIVSVIGSLYPLTTVLLARVVLHERITRVQAAGVVAAFAGIAMVSAG